MEGRSPERDNCGPLAAETAAGWARRASEGPCRGGGVGTCVVVAVGPVQGRPDEQRGCRREVEVFE